MTTPAPKVALLQRAIAHYRFPLFEKLAQSPDFQWSFFCDDHDEKMSTGLPAEGLARLDRRRTRNRRLLGPVWYQTGVDLKGVNAFMLDLGWTILSNPRYLLEARMRGIATIGWSKGIPQDPSKPDSPAKRIWQKFILSLCDVLVLYGDISREYFLRLGFPAERMFVAQNTIDTRRIAGEHHLAVEQKKALLSKYDTKGRFIFGYLGTLMSRKRVDCIIEAFSKLRSTGADAMLVLAGGGPCREELESLAGLGPYHSDIVFPGRIPVGQEAGWFQLFDVYLSYAEGGLGILEAMAHGKTVLSAPERYPETELLENNINSLLSDGFTVDSFARRMGEAIREPSRLASLGAAARESVLARATLEGMVASIQAAARCALQRHSFYSPKSTKL